MSIGSKIRILRESKNLTQVEFGKIAGVSDKAVSTWENGIAEPRMGAIQRIADYFNVSKGWIIDDEPSSSGESQPVNLDLAEQHLLSIYRDLNSEGKDKLLGYAEDLKASGRYEKNMILFPNLLVR